VNRSLVLDERYLMFQTLRELCQIRKQIRSGVNPISQPTMYQFRNGLALINEAVVALTR
jgi:hypothetical protein